MRPPADGASARGRDVDEPPPILGSWRNVYVVLVVELAALVALFRLITWWAS